MKRGLKKRENTNAKTMIKVIEDGNDDSDHDDGDEECCGAIKGKVVE